MFPVAKPFISASLTRSPVCIFGKCITVCTFWHPIGGDRHNKFKHESKFLGTTQAAIIRTICIKVNQLEFIPQTD